MGNQTKERTEGIGVAIPSTIPASAAVTSKDVAPLNSKLAITVFSAEEQKEIRALADSIDVKKIENVMNYGAAPLKMTFEQCGKFLKDEKGSRAEQEVIARVVELSKKASDSNEEFNLVLQEPNFFQRVFMKMSYGRESRVQKIQHTAITSYKLLAELMTSYESWIEMLKKSMEDIEYSALSDIEANQLLEKYIIAGDIAKERIEKELKELQSQYQKTGLQKYSYDYEEMKQGYDTFLVTMNNLNESRVMYYLSVGQLALIKRSNINVQISIHTQSKNNMALIGQQLRNAVLNAKTREVLEGQKAISRLSDELIKDISKTVGITAEETEKLIYSGIYNIEAAKEAVATVINSCETIKQTASEMLPKMQANMDEINGLIKKLEPYVGSSVETLKIEEKNPSTGGKELKF